jgi:hypothetical protein
MPCIFGLLSHPRSGTDVQPNGLPGVTVTVRWILLVTAAYGTRVAQPASATWLRLARTATTRGSGEPPRVTTASLASRERGGSQMVGRIALSRAACSSLPGGLVVVSLTQRGRAAISAGVQDAGLGAEGVASEVGLLRVAPVREAPVPQPQPLSPRLVGVFGAGKGCKPQVLQG